MLKLFNKEHVAISALTNLKDYKIEYLLSGEDLVEFSLSISDENIHLVEEEGYIRTKFNEYVIKAIDPSQNFKRFSCIVNIEDIKAKSIKSFDTTNNNITDTIRLAIAGTGWILADNNINKRRTVRVQNTNALDVLREIRKVFRVDFRFDAINKIIYVYEQYGSDKGVYFTDELNLISLNIPSDTYDYATRLFPYGKDGLTIIDVNSGKEYIENFQYSNKVIEVIWEDNRYTNVNSLKEDAKAKLDELSKPKRTYQASVSDLAKQSEEYSFLDFFLGDTVTLLSKKEKFRDKQRIVKYIQYPNNPSQNTCELGNTTLTFEELQAENEAKNNVVDNITSDNGTIDGSKVNSITTEQISDFEASVGKITNLTVINAEITNLKAQNVNITGELNTVKANVGTLIANVATIDSLTVAHTAQINDLKTNSATITQLNTVSATIGTLESEVGKIQTLVNGNLSSENIQAGGITSDKLTIANGFITNVMIANLDVSKINAGDISTNKFKIKSDDGGIEIVGATQQFKDKNNKVRVQIGKDSQGNFNFIIKGEDGTTTLIDHNGIKSEAIADNLIVDNMIASDAVGEKQINYSSFATGFNKDTNTNTIKSTKIHLNNQNQTLEVAFNSLKTQADGTKSLTESHSTTIGVMQGQINTAINNTQIVKDGQTILLKDDYNRTVQTVNSINSTLGSHTTKINEHTGKIKGVETKVNAVERDLNSITQRVSSTETNVSTVITTANNALTNANKGINLANAMKDGKMIHTDPNFRKGKNSVGLYNNSGGAHVVCNRITKPNDCPTTSTHCIEIKHIGTTATPGRGGFYQYIQSRANAVFLQKFIAKVPIGCTLNMASNSMGDGYTQKWLTSNIGTGKWEEYIREVRCGSTGTFSTGGHVYISGGHTPTASNPLIWYLAYCTSIDITDNDESVNNLNTELTSTKNKVSSIETTLSSISSKVTSLESFKTTVDDKVISLEDWRREAEQKITDASIISTVSTQFYKKGETDSKYASQTQIAQLDNKISLKVDVNGVKSIIEQNPNSIKIGFNGISNNVEIDSIGMYFKREGSQHRNISIQGATLHMFNWSDGRLHGGLSPVLLGNNSSLSSSGITIQNANGASFLSFGRDDRWTDASVPSPNYQEAFLINYLKRGNNPTETDGIHSLHRHYFHQDIGMNKKNIDNASAITSDSLTASSWITTPYISSNAQLMLQSASGTNIDLKCGRDVISYGAFIPSSNNVFSIGGWPDGVEKKWASILVGKVEGTSSRQIKSDIKYISSDTKKYECNTKTPKAIEFYNLFKNINFATYTLDYNKPFEGETLTQETGEDIQVGIIAEDIKHIEAARYFMKERKVILEKDGESINTTSYYVDMYAYISMLGVVLQEEIRLRDKLEKQILNYKKYVNFN